MRTNVDTFAEEDDRAIADAFYTLLSAGIVVLAGLAISAVVLGTAGQQGKAVAGQLDDVGETGMEKGLYAFYYTADASGALPSSDPDRFAPGDYRCTRVETGISLAGPDLPGNAPASEGLVIWAGQVAIREPGDYTFRLESADGAWLWLDGTLIAGSRAGHSPGTVYSAPLRLTAGCHAIKAKYFYADSGSASCRVSIGKDSAWYGPAYYR